ncbi:MAG: DUF342 domain-containing protein, partial [Planctomycetota bacterium]
MSDELSTEGLNLLKERVTDFGTAYLYIDEAAMNAYLRVEHAEEDICAVLVEEFLEECSITQNLREEDIEALCEEALRQPETGLHLVAVGSTMQKGRDGYLDYAKRPSEPQIIDIKTDDENVNYREIKKFDNIQKDDVLATLVPATPGESGADVFGKVIPSPKVNEFQVKAGPNVEFDEASSRFTATASGHLIYKHKKLSVEPVYVVDKHLDMHHGNIRFIGEVTVGGDILDDFEVTAAMGITVQGTVEACQLISGKDIKINGGVTGKGRGKIQTKGRVIARYLNEATIISNDDVVVEKEIVNSTVHTLGRVIIKKGCIMGSEVVALRGIYVLDAGSEIGTPTTLAAGLHYKVFKKLRELDSRLVDLLNKQQEHLGHLQEWLTKAADGERVTSRRHTQIEEKITTVRDQEQVIESLSKETGEIRETFSHHAIPYISVERQAYESVTVVTGMFERTYHEQKKGPITFSPDELLRKPILQSGTLINKIWKDGIDQDEAEERKSSANRKDISLAEIEELYAVYAAQAGSRAKKNKTILVAEDQTNMRLLLVRQLEREGYDILEAENGKEVLA